VTGPGESAAPPGDTILPEIVVVGSASRDLSADDRRGWRLGGGVSYGALTLAGLGFRTGAVLGIDDPGARAAELDLLRLAGVDLRLVPLDRAPVFDNRVTTGERVQLCLEPGDPLLPESIPTEWRGVPAWLLAPVAAELPEDWARVPSGDSLVALGWQGLLRHLPRGGIVRLRRPQASALLARADVVGVGHADLEPDVTLDSLVALLRPGATLVVTQGDRGGLLLEAGPDGTMARRRYPAIPSRRVVDSTGAGDVFLAAFVAARLNPALRGSGRRAADLRIAAAAASLVVERAGLLGVPDLPAVVRRLRASLHLPRADETDAPAGDDGAPA
jgi:sugar/nucleoside kinase (ribokinase family)